MCGWGTFAKVVMIGILRSLWAYRGFVLGSVKREFQLKYRNSMLGAAWTVINPVAMIFVYTVIFSKVMKAKLPGDDKSFAYSIYICSGLLSWGLFTEIVTRSQTVFIENANLLKKVSFPRPCLPVVTVLNAIVNFAIVFGLFTVFLIFTGNFPGWRYLALIPVFAILVAFSLGLGVTLGVLNVFFRDVGLLFGIVLQFWFWFTPIVYPISILPAVARDLLVYNPMAGLLGACQRILVSGQWPDWASLLPVSILALGLCLFSWRLFRRRSGEMVDEL
jgi:lipopolysaccharide transport system permease protein